MRICSQCILPETFPGISFNADNVCSLCQKFSHTKDQLGSAKKQYKQKFLELVKQVVPRPNHPAGLDHQRSYDLLMAYSGGKDSTYTMGLLRQKYHLRVLAVSFDNGFISPRAVTNIKNVTDSLGVDHVYFKPRWDLLKKVFAAATDRELYAKKTLERASTLCTSCMGIVKSVCLKMAVEMDIPLIAYGWSPGQAPVESSIMKNNPALVKMFQNTVLSPLREIAGDDINAYFLQARHFALPDKFPYNVHPMAWETYNEEMLLHDIERFGWTAPTDTDSNSTNCLLNALANDVHVKRYQFHPYVWEIANMVREGVMEREAGYAKIYSAPIEASVQQARERLGIAAPCAPDHGRDPLLVMNHHA